VRGNLIRMLSRPLIGVSTSELRGATDHGETPHGEPARQELALGVRYLDAVARAGGVPVILAPVCDEAIDGLLDRLSGICLSGGPDLHPSAYGAEPHPRLGPTEPNLDRFELALARRADARGVPLLGICRGSQVLNVARGGTLHQHVPDLAGDDVEHRQTTPGGEPTHPVRIARRSRLAGVVGAARLPVNSFHHQAVDALGSGLTVSARALDGVVEGIEDRSRDLFLGVQWHAECLVSRPAHLALFTALVDAARRRDGQVRHAMAA
jgi:putative glutamine amidotransferase